MKVLRVRLLGALEIEGCDPKALGRRQVRTLLRVLALARGQPVASDRLAECLWGDTPPSKPSGQLSVLASRLRGVVGADRVRQSDAGYSLSVDWLDVDALEEYAAEADRRLADGAIAAARAAASAGLSLLRGTLFADEPDAPWADAERNVVDRLVARVVHTAASAALAGGDWAAAAELGNRIIEADPFDEVGLRLVMESLARSGRPASALAAYASMRERLADELGVSPSPPTEALHSAILLGQPEVGPDAASPRTADESGLPGRAEAIRMLDAGLGAAVGGRGQIVLVEGEAGIGKSRLLEFWLARIGPPVRVVSVSCNELGRSLPLEPLLEVVRSLVRDPGAGTASDVLGPDIAVLGPLVGIASEPTHPAQLAALTDPGAGRSLLFAALFNVVRRQSRLGPLVLAIDDLHVADAATTAWVGQAAKRCADVPVLVVVARRVEEAVPIPGVTTVLVGPLDVDAVRAIVGGARAEDLFVRSGGHPLFLVELAGVEPGADLPASIRQAVEERCVRAGPAGVTVRTAAAIGPEIDLDILAAVTGAPSGQLLDHLEEGVRRRLLVESGASFAFAHGLVREALAATVNASRTAFVHREAARALGARPGADPLMVAHHARLGGELSQASQWLVAAARMAVARFDYEEALRLLDDSIGLADSAAARLERARVHSMLAGDELADADLRVATELGAGAEAIEVAAWSAHYRRRFDEALTLADRGARESTDPEIRASCLALGGWVSLSSGDLAGSERRLEQAVASAASAGAGRLAETWLGWLRTYQSRPEETLRLVRPEPGTGLASYRFPNAYAQMAATMALATLGRVDEALATLDAFSADIARMDAQRWTPRPFNLRGWIVRNLGGFSEAEELHRAAIEAAQPHGMTEPLANALLDLAAGRLLQDDLDGAAALLDEADELSAVQHSFRWRHQLRARLLRARLDLASGAAERALEDAELLGAEATALGMPRYEIQAGLVAALARRTLGRADLDETDRLLSRLGAVAGLEAWWITAGVARAFGVDAWEDLAGRRLGALSRVAGPYAPALERWGRRLL